MRHSTRMRLLQAVNLAESLRKIDYPPHDIFSELVDKCGAAHGFYRRGKYYLRCATVEVESSTFADGYFLVRWITAANMALRADERKRSEQRKAA